MSYTLIIAEKPSASVRIAYALAEGGVKRITKRGSYYFMIKRRGKEIVVAPAVGHLFVLAEKGGNGEWAYPVFSVEWKPTFSQGSAWAGKYFQNIRDLAKGASEFISATDYDVEGSVIAYNILRFICGTDKAGRMKFSTLTTPDLVEAYENASPQLDFPQIEAGLTRHYLDYFWGISLSRALTLALEHASGYKTLSTGRVQGPTLYLLEKRQREIEAFVPKPFWLLHLIASANGESIEAHHEKGQFWDRKEADGALARCRGKPAMVEEVRKEQYRQYPFPPFDLTTLQRDSYAHFHYSPKQTLDIAQSLYEMGAISYPRTSSQKLPAKIGYRKILEGLKKIGEYRAFAESLLGRKSLRPREGKKTDPAHPAIFVTSDVPDMKRLSRYQKNIYDLIAKRLLSCFADPALRESVNAVIGINGERFRAEGVRTVQENWIGFYKPYAKFKEAPLPEMREGQGLKVKGLEILDKETQPPNRFTQASILKEMESENLGTKATRSQILQTLYDRDYIRESSILVTRLGDAVVTALEKFCPEIISVELTREFERSMEEIREGKEKRAEVLKKSEEILRKILDGFRRNEPDIGKELLKGVIEMERQRHDIGKCPKCGRGELRIIHSKKTRKRFAACDQYPECKTTFPLPQHGDIAVLGRKCKCGLGLLSVKSKGRPWTLCVKCGFARKFKKMPGKGPAKTA